MEFMLDKIGRMAIFLVCAQTILHFRAKASYEKYIKLLVSMMLLLLLAEPLLEIMQEGSGKEINERIDSYEKELESILQNHTLYDVQITEILSRMTEKEVDVIAEKENSETTRQIQEIEQVNIEVKYGGVTENNGEDAITEVVPER